jgi:hypothetical protein
MRINRPLIATGLLLMLGLASPSSGVPPETGFPAHLRGEVTDADGRPLAGVTVRLFVGGSPVASARTDSSGAYDLAFAVDPNGRETMLACAVAPRPDLVSEWAILRESSEDRDAKLWGPCVPRIGLSRSARWSVGILDATGVRERIAKDGCLGAGSVVPHGQGYRG